MVALFVQMCKNNKIKPFTTVATLKSRCGQPDVTAPNSAEDPTNLNAHTPAEMNKPEET